MKGSSLQTIIFTVSNACAHISTRLNQIRDTLKNQLDFQFNQLTAQQQQQIPRAPKYIVGELESDNDERLLSRSEWEQKLRASNSKIQGLEEKVC